MTDDLAIAGGPGVGLGRLIPTSTVIGLLSAVGALLVTALPAVAVCSGLAGAWLPLSLLHAKARRARAIRRDLWPDVVDNIASAVRAGMSLPEALTAVAHRGPAQLRAPFAEFGEDYRVTGRFPDCLDRLKERLADPVADRLVESIRIARDVGGSDLGRLLRTLSGFLREEARTRGELETRQGWTISAARLASVAPWAVLVMLSTRPESVQAYQRPAGVLVLAVGAVVSALAYWIMLRIARLPVEARVLR
ncbi:MAG TPA: type II secretion system F family protein [Dermatophilaceae bacterium]|nr:type II secretion system F family protein [Dermatophilaceae bacterium]